MGSGDFENFYTAHYGDTVAMTYGYTADLGEAQDIAQEAFARAWQRWRDLSTYDNPVAWVRRVATNLAHSRWRRLRVAATYLLRERPSEPVPAIDPDHVAVVTALRKLPAPQREAVVLHHLLDMPITEVAEQLDVPVGTVKSWLHRGRSALAEDLRIDVRGAITTPPAQRVAERAHKQQRVRRSAVAAAVAVAMAGAWLAVHSARAALPLPPTDEPTPRYTVDPEDPMLARDWRAVTIDLRDAPEGCPDGLVSFRGPDTGKVTGPVAGWPSATFHPDHVSIGDLTGDGRAEAALIITCWPTPEADDRPHHILVVRRGDGGSLHALAWTGRAASLVMSTWIGGGVLFADTRPHPSSQVWRYRLGEVDGWRWNGGMFAPEITAPAYRQISHVDLSAVVAKLPMQSWPSQIPDDLTTQSGGWQWNLQANLYQTIWAELGRPGRPYLLLTIVAAPHAGADEATVLVICDRDGDTWRALDAVPGGDLLGVGGKEVTVLQPEGPVTYLWDGGSLVRQ